MLQEVCFDAICTNEPLQYFLFNLYKVSQYSNPEFDLIFFNYFNFLKLDLVNIFCLVLSMTRSGHIYDQKMGKTLLI